ncbi:MAG: UDP-N-acetylglucosamine--N-acetylmuramyl-(pentapeptide) pyrophosphoryl-undecaprenol N-acetylglucosamine transferase [Synergistaceae bacterium]|nr:UDP-N-acetylglucosamine--N-acetylmuramyl-(pentapeptide) pyrophosphoryl-undecaprenol N-acetylglucosamine transferase [Synergistaceae bacterium]
MKVMIAAGGTGGHIFPALAFGRWILEHGKAESVVYVSGSRPLEAEIYAFHGIEPYRLAIAGSPLGGGLRSAFGRCAGLFRSFMDTRFFLRKERPDLCFLFGSYVSLAPLLWCKWLGVPAAAHEQNACAGKVTRLASRMGVPVASGWSECRGASGAFHVGVPVRSFRRLSKREAASVLGVKTENGGLVIGVAGGSLGSAPLSALIKKIEETGKISREREILFVVLGEQDGTSVAGVEFVGRRWDMAPFYSLCDAVVCRAGASTLAELAAFGIPALTVPWRGAADGHQEANARNFSSMTGNPTWIEGERGEEGLKDAFGKLLERIPIVQRHSGDFVNDAASSALWEFGKEKCEGGACAL